MKMDMIFQSIEIEVAEKIETMMTISGHSREKLLHISKKKFSPKQEKTVASTINFAKSLTSVDTHHPSIQAYINHPVRVSTMVLQSLKENQYEYTIIGLLHNVYEIGGLTESYIVQAGYNESTSRAIRTLTIDRKKQYDTDYLSSYYKAIRDFSPELALVRCLDKLDNMLAFELIREENNRSLYLKLIHRFIVPMAKELSPDLGFYIEELGEYMQTVGCNPDLAERYESFQKKIMDK